MTPAQWAPVAGYEGLYEISSVGAVRSIKRGRLLRPHVTGSGYQQVMLSRMGQRSWYTVHRLVGVAFVPNPAGAPQINHKNGVKTDNRSSNLEWVSMSENLQHRHRVLGVPGSRCKPVLCINTGVVYPSAKAAAVALGLRPSGITQVCNGHQKTTKKLKFSFLED